MKRFFIIIMSCSIMICHCQKKVLKVPPPPISKVKYKLACGESDFQFSKIEQWYNEKQNYDKSRYSDFKKVKSLYEVKKNYYIKKGLLFLHNKIVSNLKINYQYNDSIEYDLEIKKGKPIIQIIEVSGNPKPSMHRVEYTKDGVTYKFLKNTSYLNKGNGNLRLYYYGKWNPKNQNFSIENIKSEGEVKNYFKVGEWKYYDKNGKVDSTNTYSLKDSIDVRFPYCIFNKKEQYFCDK
jgi:hypothetical protein